MNWIILNNKYAKFALSSLFWLLINNVSIAGGGTTQTILSFPDKLLT